MKALPTIILAALLLATSSAWAGVGQGGGPRPKQLNEQLMKDLGIERVTPQHPGDRRYKPITAPAPQGEDRG